MQPNNKCKRDIKYEWIIHRYIHTNIHIHTKKTKIHIHTNEKCCGDAVRRWAEEFHAVTEMEVMRCDARLEFLQQIIFVSKTHAAGPNVPFLRHPSPRLFSRTGKLQVGLCRWTAGSCRFRWLATQRLCVLQCVHTKNNKSQLLFGMIAASNRN